MSTVPRPSPGPMPAGWGGCRVTLDTNIQGVQPSPADQVSAFPMLNQHRDGESSEGQLFKLRFGLVRSGTQTKHFLRTIEAKKKSHSASDSVLR